MPRVGFEPTITASERAKTVHALDRDRLEAVMVTQILQKRLAWRIFEPKGEEVAGASRKLGSEVLHNLQNVRMDLHVIL
jgi:hypothetical protein